MGLAWFQLPMGAHSRVACLRAAVIGLAWFQLLMGAGVLTHHERRYRRSVALIGLAWFQLLVGGLGRYLWVAVIGLA